MSKTTTFRIAPPWSPGLLNKFLWVHTVILGIGRGYLTDRHCFGLSCPWGEGGRKEGERGEAEAEVPAAVVGREQMEKEEKGGGKGVEGKERRESEGDAEGLEDEAALATAVSFLLPPSRPPSRLLFGSTPLTFATLSSISPTTWSPSPPPPGSPSAIDKASAV